MTARVLLGLAVIAAIVGAVLILRGVRAPAARAPAGDAASAAALPPSARTAAGAARDAGDDADDTDDTAPDDPDETDDPPTDPAVARAAEALASAQRARQGRMSTAVRGALAGVVRACAPELASPTAGARPPIFLRADTHWTGGQISIRAIDVRLGAQPAPPRFARCVADRATALQLPWIADEASGSTPLAFSFTLP